METAIFPYDNNVKIIYNPYFGLLHNDIDKNLNMRTTTEKTFRKLITYFLNKGILDKSKNILDSGAWIGDNALPWAINTSGVVYAIDPSKNNCEFMDETASFNVIDNINIICTALSDKEEILYTTGNISHCSFVYDYECKVIEPHTSETCKESCQATSIDLLHKQNVVTNLGFIHLDVEGMEYRVLKGAEECIDLYRPLIVYEVHLDLDPTVNLIQTFLDGKSYVVKIMNEQFEGTRYDCRNILACPKEIYTTIDWDEVKKDLGVDSNFFM